LLPDTASIAAVRRKRRKTVKNIKMTVTGDHLLIDIDLHEQGDPSKSGKSIIIASTEGNKDVPGAPGIKIGVNVYKPKV
jgi:hypothetical protein